MLDSTDILRELTAKRKAFRAAIEARAVGKVSPQNARRPNEAKTGKSRALKDRARYADDDARIAVASAAAVIAFNERREYLELRHAEIMAMIEAGLQNRPIVREIIRIVCERYGVTVDDIMSLRRTENILWPRHIAMYLSRVLTLRSLPELGRSFCGRDHTTILHAERKIHAMMYGGSAPRFSRGHYAARGCKSFKPDPAFRHHVELIATDIVDRMLRAKAKERADVG